LGSPFPFSKVLLSFVCWLGEGVLYYKSNHSSSSQVKGALCSCHLAPAKVELLPETPKVWKRGAAATATPTLHVMHQQDRIHKDWRAEARDFHAHIQHVRQEIHQALINLACAPARCSQEERGPVHWQVLRINWPAQDVLPMLFLKAFCFENSSNSHDSPEGYHVGRCSPPIGTQSAEFTGAALTRAQAHSSPLRNFSYLKAVWWHPTFFWETPCWWSAYLVIQVFAVLPPRPLFLIPQHLCRLSYLMEGLGRLLPLLRLNLHDWIAWASSPNEGSGAMHMCGCPALKLPNDPQRHRQQTEPASNAC